MSDEPHTQQRRIGVGMVIAAWVGAILLAGFFFGKMLERQHNPNQQLASYTPGETPEVVLQRNKFGHYVASGTINDQPVVFILDTGASDVSIPAGVAQRLGLQRGPTTTYHTANGPITAYRTELGEVRLGGIVLRDIAASINPAVRDNEVLLGMSFLKHLEFTQRGDTLTLRQYSPD
jgi:aspartyl protease family protein